MIARIAWRNLWRNKSRTAIVVSAIAFSYGLMLFMFGITQDSYAQMGDLVVEALGGHVLVHGEGYWDLPTGGQVVEDPSAKRAHIEEMPQVAAVAERVIAYGLVGTAQTTEGAQILGVRPDDERAFGSIEDDLIEGSLLSEEQDNPAVIGAADADALGVGIGDRLVITGTEIGGEVTRGLFFVDGILESTPGQVDEGRVYVRLEDLQPLLGYGDGVTQIGIRLHDDATRHAVVSNLRQHYAGQSLEVLAWDEAMPEFLALIELDRAFTWLYLLIIVFIVVLGITNTFLMVVMERIREFGLLSALGLGPKRIGLLIMVETAMVAFVGMGIGLVMGLAGHFWVATYGIDMGAVADHDFDVAGISMDMVVRSHLDVSLWLTGSLVIFVFICLSAIYPAWRATRLAPSEAMRFYE